MRRHGFRAEVNVTPLVDVCLVLLIIFMVVAQHMSPGKAVRLPDARNGRVEPTTDAIYLSLVKDGRGVTIWWDQDAVADAAAVGARVATSHPRRIYVKADADLSYGDVYPVLASLHAAGEASAELAVREPQAGR